MQRLPQALLVAASAFLLLPVARAQVVQGIGLLPGHIASRSECISGDGTTAGGDSTGTLSDAVRWPGALAAIPQPVASNAMITYGLSGDGSVAAGIGVDVSSNQYAWRWQSPTTQVLPSLVGVLSAGANDVDSSGAVILGTFGYAYPTTRAVRWVQSGPLFVPQLLAGFPSTCTWSEGIALSNNANHVAGTLDPMPSYAGVRAFRWDASTSTTLTSPFLPTGTYTAAFGMSGDGQHVVGWGDTSGGNHAFRWTPDGNLMLDLGTVPGHVLSLAYDACYDGSVVVGFSNLPPAPSAASLWTSSLGMVDLNVYLPSIGVSTTNWYLRICDGISDDGRTLTGTGAYQYAPNQWRTEGWILNVPNAPWVSWPVVTFCPAVPHSLGFGTLLEGLGSSSIASSSFKLASSGGIPGQLHIYYYGPEAASVPFGDGTRCVGPGGLGVFRLLPARPYSAAGTDERALDFTLPPAGGGPGWIQPGSTWYFQDWYRDPFHPAGTGHNLSNGLQVTFTP